MTSHNAVRPGVDIGYGSSSAPDIEPGLDRLLRS